MARVPSGAQSVFFDFGGAAVEAARDLDADHLAHVTVTKFIVMERQ